LFYGQHTQLSARLPAVRSGRSLAKASGRLSILSLSYRFTLVRRFPYWARFGERAERHGGQSGIARCSQIIERQGKLVIRYFDSFMQAAGALFID
jgi:hypothetical protein